MGVSSAESLAMNPRISPFRLTHDCMERSNTENMLCGNVHLIATLLRAHTKLSTAVEEGTAGDLFLYL